MMDEKQYNEMAQRLLFSQMEISEAIDHLLIGESLSGETVDVSDLVFEAQQFQSRISQFMKNQEVFDDEQEKEHEDQS